MNSLIVDNVSADSKLGGMQEVRLEINVSLINVKSFSAFRLIGMNALKLEIFNWISNRKGDGGLNDFYECR